MCNVLNDSLTSIQLRINSLKWACLSEYDFLEVTKASPPLFRKCGRVLGELG